MTGAFLHIDEGVLGAEGVLAIEYNFYLAIHHIECLLHIWMDMGCSYFAFLEGGDCYLGEGTAGLATGEENTLLTYAVGGEDRGYVGEVSDHIIDTSNKLKPDKYSCIPKEIATYLVTNACKT